MVNGRIIKCAKKIGSIIFIANLMLSMTGCFNLFGLGKSTENQDAVREAIAEGNFVEEWKGDIPEGMEVAYVLVKDQQVTVNDNLFEYLYKYDDQGRLVYYCDVRSNGYKLFETAYDDNGNIISKKQTHEGYVGSAGFPDIEIEYKYNDDGLLVYYKTTQLYNDTVYEHFLEYDENGHLISLTDGNGNIREFEVNLEEIPYYETVAVISDVIEATEPDFVTMYYNGGGYLIKEQTDKYVITYQYDNGEVYQSTKEFTNSDLKNTYDANGNILSSSMSSAGELEVTEYQYNEHNDLILYEVTKGGVLKSRASYSYEYDENGNMITKTTESYRITDKGEEYDLITVDMYTYDEHGLLVTDEHSFDDGGFQELHVYYYKAILVPVD